MERPCSDAAQPSLTTATTATQKRLEMIRSVHRVANPFPPSQPLTPVRLVVDGEKFNVVLLGPM